jgi:hypothetical protein
MAHVYLLISCIRPNIPIWDGKKEIYLDPNIIDRLGDGLTPELLEDWFYKISFPYFRRLEKPKVLIGDNLASHLTISVIQECNNKEIRLVLLPPNTTHTLQPLDVAHFRPLKGSWRKN